MLTRRFGSVVLFLLMVDRLRQFQLLTLQMTWLISGFGQVVVYNNDARRLQIV